MVEPGADRVARRLLLGAASGATAAPYIALAACWVSANRASRLSSKYV